MGVEARGGGGSVRPFYSTTGKIGALIPSDGYKVACLNGLDGKAGKVGRHLYSRAVDIRSVVTIKNSINGHINIE
jgi:hypothetical protein